MVGAGLAGLATALYLRGTGRDVTIIERQGGPGGRHGSLEIGGYHFDTGPELLFTPEQLAAPLHAVGERLHDWIELLPLDPVCRAHYPDGTTIDVHSDPHRTAAAIGAVCGGREARAYLRFARAARFGLPAAALLHDPRTRRLFGGAGLFGFPPTGNAWFARGGQAGISRTFAAVCEKHGISVEYLTSLRRFETRHDQAVAVITDDGRRLPVDAVAVPRRTVGRGPSCLVIHLGAKASYDRVAHHNVHFGAAWQRSKHELLVRGELMSDPTLLVSAPSRTDASLGRHVYRVTVPVPNLRKAPANWDAVAGRDYAGEIMATLEARGYLDLGASVRVSYVVTPADWARQGMAYGIPAGDPGYSRLHPRLANVVISGSGLHGGRQAALRMMGIA